MKSIWNPVLPVVVCLLAGAAPADPPPAPAPGTPPASPGTPASPATPASAELQTLTLADLVDRPDRWPPSVTLTREFDFGDGLIARKGQQVYMLKFDGVEAQVDDGNDLTFGVTMEDCDLLNAANKNWATLTPAQRAIDSVTILQDPSLWPEKVKCLSGFNLDSGVHLPPGGEFELISIVGGDVRLYSREHDAKLVAFFRQTDMFARARQRVLIEPDKRSSRIAAALRQGLVDSSGKAYTADSLGSAKVFVFYYGASFSEPCRKFSAALVEYINSVGPQNPRLAVVMLSNDKDSAKMLAYMQDQKMPWPALPQETLDKTPIFSGYEGDEIPQLVIVDRHGKVLSNSFLGSRNLGPAIAMKSLKRIIDSAAAK